jgi:catechol 2,3-dioxygenase-like lactoylglutathione lyase family enzyme
MPKSRPKIRHLAVMSRDPDELAKFYIENFDMEELNRSEGRNGIPAIYLTDGYINLALLPCSLQGESTPGLNHFGFQVESIEDASNKMVAAGVESPKARPSTREYAEFRGADPQGNLFDLSVHGFQESETRAAREEKNKDTLVDA